ncbi:hypothetical protein LTR53_000247 [Teratosphaeriaceae sp. CCFEE 6253]|nr:hypothetical protein LTR53_000247 [Teratosphaeriaceae sp. CCFEE 6253]
MDYEISVSFVNGDPQVRRGAQIWLVSMPSDCPAFRKMWFASNDLDQHLADEDKAENSANWDEWEMWYPENDRKLLSLAHHNSDPLPEVRAVARWARETHDSRMRWRDSQLDRMAASRATHWQSWMSLALVREGMEFEEERRISGRERAREVRLLRLAGLIRRILVAYRESVEKEAHRARQAQQDYDDAQA